MKANASTNFNVTVSGGEMLATFGKSDWLGIEPHTSCTRSRHLITWAICRSKDYLLIYLL